ncbi:MAG: M48 family metallopeptidase [candidate division Zixibacteria bacterium]|nr:M48 family metallopeptidase [candidate division Zixibacteria bacterium]MDH3937029.1 M48 family metallopeptidase [candidate division Zixibacteria bacterium]MDH4032950.1 M48 family metallopeptidase [candidate division Zixibacteria bacterium]
MNTTRRVLKRRFVIATLLTLASCLLFCHIAAADSPDHDSSGERQADSLQQSSAGPSLPARRGVDPPLSAGLKTDLPYKTETPESLYPMSPERKEELISYSRFRNIWRFASFLIGIGTLALILLTGLSAKLRDLACRIRLRFFAVWVFYIFISLVDYMLNLPFTIYRSFIVENNYGFLNQTFMQWWGENLLGLLLGLIVGIIPVWFFYWLVSKMKRWWLAFSLGAIPFVVILIVIVPVFVAPLFNKFEPLKDKQLEAEILALAESAGIEGSDIFQVDGSRQSSKVNAYVTGLFGTKRIVLYDTMIENFTLDEIRYVMGHEMGHYLMNHLWWGLAVAIIFIMFALWLMDKTIHGVIHRFRTRLGFDKLSDMASLPLVLIFVLVINFVFQPITNSASRYMERQSDKFGMDVTGVSGETAAVTFDKLSVYNLSDPDPHVLIEFWFYTHPALKKRTEFVRGYRR